MEEIVIPTDSEIQGIMQDDFGYSCFKSVHQEKSVKAVLNGEKDVIVSMPTNSGKSLCFQFPGKHLDLKFYQINCY